VLQIKHVGVSNETAYGVMEFSQLAEQNISLPRIVTIQVNFHSYAGFFLFFLCFLFFFCFLHLSELSLVGDVNTFSLCCFLLLYLLNIAMLWVC
jgi:hypothetical protein